MLQTTDVLEISPTWQTLEFLWYLFSTLCHTSILTICLEYFLLSAHQAQETQYHKCNGPALCLME